MATEDITEDICWRMLDDAAAKREGRPAPDGPGSVVATMHFNLRDDVQAAAFNAAIRVLRDAGYVVDAKATRQ